MLFLASFLTSTEKTKSQPGEQPQKYTINLGLLVEFNIPFQHKYGYVRDEHNKPRLMRITSYYKSK